MYIHSAEIKNIRSLKTLKMDWAEHKAGWHVVIGENGAGKTALLQAISLALLGDKRASMLRLDWSNWLRKTKEEESKAEIKLELYNDKNQQIATDRVVITKQRKENRAFLDSEWSFNLNADSPRYPENWQHERDTGWFSAAYGPYRGFQGGSMEFSRVSKISPKLAAHLSCLEPYYTQLDTIEWVKRCFERGKNGQLLLDYIKKLLKSEGLLPASVRFQKIDLTGIWFKEENGSTVDIGQLSNGYASVLAITLDLIFRLTEAYTERKILDCINNDKFVMDLPGVVLIDEIDIHLHPSWQVRIGKWFTQYFPKLQFIVTTHSPLVCRACGQNGTIWKLDKSSSSKNQIQLVKGLERDRLVYGDILDAYATSMFGDNLERSKESQELLLELAQLNRLSFTKEITEAEKIRRQELLTIFAKNVASNY